MKNKHKTKTLGVCLGVLFLFLGNFNLKAQCEFSDFELIKITAGTDAVFQVKSIPNYQPIYTWDYSAAPLGVHFLNLLFLANTLGFTTSLISFQRVCW